MSAIHPKLKSVSAEKWIPRQKDAFFSGFSELDKLTGGIPRSAIVEICGQNSSGRTALVFSIIGKSLRMGNVCAYIDATNSFDPVTAAEKGIPLERFLWVRAGGNITKTFFAADTVLQSGGFSMIVVDLADIKIENLSKIPLSYWFRFKKILRQRFATLFVVARYPLTRTCADLVLVCGTSQPVWTGRAFPVLSGIQSEIIINRPVSQKRCTQVSLKSELFTKEA